MNKKNIVLVFSVAIILLLNWNVDLRRENRAYKDRIGGANRESVEETIDALKPFYDVDIDQWEKRLQEKSGEALLDAYIDDLRRSNQYFHGLYRSDISLLSGTLGTVIYLLEELKENGKLNKMQREDLQNAVLQARSIAGQLITIAGSSENGWYIEFVEEESDAAKYVRDVLKNPE